MLALPQLHAAANVTAAWQIRGNFPAKLWQPFFFAEPPAATSAPQEKPGLAARNIARARVCFRFAARLVTGVNVRDLRESRVGRKCLTQRWISCHTTQRLRRASS